MMYLPTDIILHLLDFEGNRIKRIDSRSVRIKTEQLNVDNNPLTEIDESAFHGSEIGRLSLKRNIQLQHIHPFAFVGLISIRQLDLSGSSLIDLPSLGLQELEFLKIQDTHSLKKVPSIYNFKNLKVALLTHPFHCCAFKFPSRHDPLRHAQRVKDLEILRKACRDNTPLSEEKLNRIQSELGYAWSTEVNYLNNARMTRSVENSLLVHETRKRLIRNSMTRDDFEGHIMMGDSWAPIPHNHSSSGDSSNSFIKAIRGSQFNNEVPDISDYKYMIPDLGEFHETTADLSVNNNNFDALCGNFTQKKVEFKCYPMPDALNPCEDVMGSNWLRASVWVVVLLAVFGNFAVLIVLLSSRSDTSVPKFLMSNLAFADLCMGLYLLLIASIDAHSMGEYFNYAFDWQYGAGCKIAGFLTVFASHLSVFTLTIITLERWFAITNAIYLNKRIKIKPAIYIMIAGWIYSFCMSSLPLFGISNYSSTSICLPMEARDPWDVVYLVSILGTNGAAFFVIAICYGQIYFSLGKKTRRSSTTGEMTVAKKMALLVFTNFSCWAPIAFFGLTALAGYPLINITKSKILLVFFYPLNSCADPYLYAILTAQYRRDLYLLLSKFGICQQKAAQYRSSFSLPVTHQTNQTIPINLNHRESMGLTAQKSLEGQNMLSSEDFV